MADDARAVVMERRLWDDTSLGAPSRGTRALIAILPNGRVAWLQVDPALVPAATTQHIAHAAEQALRWRRAATASNSEAIQRLAETVVADAERLTETRLDRTEALRRRMVKEDNRLDGVLTTAAAAFHSRLEKQLTIERQSVRRLQRRGFWDRILVATAWPLFAAYGQRGRPLGGNNLALTLAALIWVLGDEVKDLLFGRQERSPYPLRDTDVWSYIAPFGNLLAGWWLLNDLQHERFVAGSVTAFTHHRTTAAGTRAFRQEYVAELPLSSVVMPDHFPDFETFTHVPVVATIRSMKWSPLGVAAKARVDGLRAEVDKGILIVRFTAIAARMSGHRGRIPPLVEALDVAWVVDTADPDERG